LQGTNMICFEDIDEERETLGLSETAIFSEIKEVYHRLSLKYHPDKCASEPQKQKNKE